MKPRHVAQMLAPFAVAGVAFALYTWSPTAQPTSHPPGPGFERPPTPFEDPWDLMSSIEEGSFAERADLQEELRVPEPLPDPIRIHFESGTSVPASQRATLEDFAARIEERPAISLRVVGCSDPSGSAALNRRVSEQRAEAVAAALEGLGIDEERFASVIGRGEDCEQPERAVRVVPTRAGDRVARSD